MSEGTYTLEEAEREIMRRECAADQHAPHFEERTYTGPAVARLVCRCGLFEYRPHRRENR